MTPNQQPRCGGKIGEPNAIHQDYNLRERISCYKCPGCPDCAEVSGETRQKEMMSKATTLCVHNDLAITCPKCAHQPPLPPQDEIILPEGFVTKVNKVLIEIGAGFTFDEELIQHHTLVAILRVAQEMRIVASAEDYNKLSLANNVMLNSWKTEAKRLRADFSNRLSKVKALREGDATFAGVLDKVISILES